MAKRRLSKTNIFILVLILAVVMGNFLILTIANDKQIYQLSKELESQAEQFYQKKEFKKSLEFYKKALKNYEDLTIYRFFVKDDIARIKNKLDTDENFKRLSEGYIYYNGKWVSEKELRELLREKSELINDIHIILKTAKFFGDISSLENDIKVYESGLELIEKSKFKDDPDVKNLKKQITDKLYELYIKAGNRYKKLDELDKTAKYYEKALSIKEDYNLKKELSQVYITLAERYITEKKFNEALKTVLKAKKLGFKTEKLEEKIKNIVARLQPEKIKDVEDPSVYYFLSKKSYEAGNYQKAADLCEKSISLGKRDKEVFLLCGKANFQLKRYDKSLTFLDSITDADEEVEILKGLNLFYLGRYEEAVGYLEKYAQDENVKEHLFKLYRILGEKYIQDDPDKALVMFEKASSLKKDAAVLRKIADIYFEKSDYEKAYDYYKKAVTLDPKIRKEILQNYVKSIKVLAERSFQNKRYRKALSLYLEYLSMYPRDVKVLEKVGDLYRLLGDKKTAISYYEKIMKINRKYFDRKVAGKLLDLRLEMGDIYFANGDYERAIYHYKKALVFSDSEKLAEKLAKAYIKMGDRYLKRKDYEKALDYYIKGISLKPSLGINIEKNLGEAYIGVGEILFNKKKYKKAIKYFKKAEKFLKDDFRIFYYRGLSYLKLKDYENAIKDLEKAVSKKEDLYDIKLKLAQLYYKRKDLKNAEKYVDELISQNKFLDKVYMMKGDIYMAKGDTENAFIYYIKAEESGNRSGELYFKISKIYFKKGNSLKTVSYATKAIKKGYKSKDAYYIRGISYYKLKDYKNAIKDFSSYIKLDPDNPEVYYLRGKLYYEHGDFSKGDYGRAVSDLKKAVALGHKEAENYLKKIENK
ncbi:tetratricopeptide repeat protein [Persephonella sp.]